MFASFQAQFARPYYFSNRNLKIYLDFFFESFYFGYNNQRILSPFSAILIWNDSMRIYFFGRC